jgi:hypothetical protein
MKPARTRGPLCPIVERGWRQSGAYRRWLHEPCASRGPPPRPPLPKALSSRVVGASGLLWATMGYYGRQRVRKRPQRHFAKCRLTRRKLKEWLSFSRRRATLISALAVAPIGVARRSREGGFSPIVSFHRANALPGRRRALKSAHDPPQCLWCRVLSGR